MLSHPAGNCDSGKCFSLTAAPVNDHPGRGLQLWSGLNRFGCKRLFHDSGVLLGAARARAHTRVLRMDRCQTWMSACWNSAVNNGAEQQSVETNCRKKSSFLFRVCDDLSRCVAATSSNFFYVTTVDVLKLAMQYQLSVLQVLGTNYIRKLFLIFVFLKSLNNDWIFVTFLFLFNESLGFSIAPPPATPVYQAPSWTAAVNQTVMGYIKQLWRDAPLLPPCQPSAAKCTLINIWLQICEVPNAALLIVSSTFLPVCTPVCFLAGGLRRWRGSTGSAADSITDSRQGLVRERRDGEL